MIISEPPLEFSPSGFDFEFAAPGDYARLYRLRGIQVVPAFMPGEHKSWKRPLLDSWKDFQEALVSDEVFASWYGVDGKYAARPNMGIITGRASNNLFVIDLDHHKNPQAATWWNVLMSIHNNNMDLETVEQRTGGGGSQKLYRAPPEWTAPTSKTPMGVDIRGQGGFAMLAPSLHESGKIYQWLEGQSPDDIPVTMAPDWLLEAVEVLVAHYGGNSVTKKEAFQLTSQSSGGAQAAAYDGFGSQIDGRETYMRDMVWRVVLDWNAECPLPVSPVMSLERARKEYAVYEREVSPQEAHPADVSKAEALDREGRGWKAFHVKWQAAMRKWDGDVYREARKPGRVRAEPKPAVHDRTLQEPVIPPISGPLLLTSEQFIAGFTPPAYLIDGILQRGYLYSLTARTGHGKTAVAMYIAQCIARGEEMHGCQVKQGTVLLLAGENPDDIRARFLVLAEAYGFRPESLKMRFVAGVVNIATSMPQIRAEAADIDDLVLVIVDTAAAYFPGDETNSNSQQGAYARDLRQLTFLPGLPAVLVNCHPVKNAARDNLSPMGGSAFLNEVDGNLTLWANAEKQMYLHWQGKFRGPEFDPMAFEISVATSERVKDAKGRLMPNAVAQPISDSVLEAAQMVQESDEDKLLRLIRTHQRASLASFGLEMGLKKWQVQRIAERLKADKLAEVFRGRLRLTSKGEKELGVGKRKKDDDFG